MKERTIFFQGQAIIIQEEISVDSEEHSSVRTSEDDFDVDDHGVKGQFDEAHAREKDVDPKTKK